MVARYRYVAFTEASIVSLMVVFFFSAGCVRALRPALTIETDHDYYTLRGGDRTSNATISSKHCECDLLIRFDVLIMI